MIGHHSLHRSYRSIQAISTPDTGVYTIAKGEDLPEISRRFGTTVEAIESENGLENTRITASQRS